jgi:hypothetical protein
MNKYSTDLLVSLVYYSYMINQQAVYNFIVNIFTNNNFL